MSSLERIDYADGETALTGWLARPEGPARAGIVVFPTIMNVNAPVERRARMLAAEGYLAFIADLYGEMPESFETVGPLAAKLRETPERYRARLAAAVAALRALPDADGLVLGVIGYCLGGQAAIETARDGQDIAVAVSFHGLLDTARPAEAGAIKARLLVCHGDSDPMAPREQVMAFWQEMDAAGADWHFHSYSGVRHGFTDPGSDERDLDAVAYDASADRQSWAAMLSLFDEVFGERPATNPNVAVKERFVEAVLSGDRETVARMLHPGFVLEQPRGLVYAGRYVGTGGFMDFLERFAAAYDLDGLDNTRTFFTDDEDVLVLEFQIKGRLKSTGELFETSQLEHWYFSDGKVLRVRPHWFEMPGVP